MSSDPGRAAAVDDDGDDGSPWPRGLGTGLLIAALATLLIVVWVLGSAADRGGPVIGTDALGPDPGESAEDYLARAGADLPAPSDDGARWALVGFDRPLTGAQAAAAVGDERIGQVLLRPVPAGADPVAAPLLIVQTGAPSAAADTATLIGTARSTAAARLRDDDTVPVAPELREPAAAELDADGPVVVAAVVRAEPAALHVLAGRPEITVVEALPADAVAGRFAVRMPPILAESGDAP